MNNQNFKEESKRLVVVLGILFLLLSLDIFLILKEEAKSQRIRNFLTQAVAYFEDLSSSSQSPDTVIRSEINIIERTDSNSTVKVIIDGNGNSEGYVAPVPNFVPAEDPATYSIPAYDLENDPRYQEFKEDFDDAKERIEEANEKVDEDREAFCRDNPDSIVCD